MGAQSPLPPSAIALRARHLPRLRGRKTTHTHPPLCPKASREYSGLKGNRSAPGRLVPWRLKGTTEPMSKKRPFTDQEVLLFHSQPKPGKIEIVPSKPMDTQRDLSLAYSPGVAVPVRAIAEDPSTVYDYTAKGNLVAVISNGTAILGLGDLGPLASKPVMEGKAVLFKRLSRGKRQWL